MKVSSTRAGDIEIVEQGRAFCEQKIGKSGRQARRHGDGVAGITPSRGHPVYVPRATTEYTGGTSS